MSTHQSSPAPADTDAQATAASEHDQRGSYVKPGQAFERDMTYIPTRITRDGAEGYPVEPGRYRLIVSRACPWANRALIVRRLLGLENVISLGIAGPTHDKRSWTFDLDEGGKDPVLGIERLQEAYFRRIPDYPRGITVPAIVDTRDGAVVTNDFNQITRDFFGEWGAFHREGAPQLWPTDPKESAEMEDLMRRILHSVNNGVYKVGFAGSQEAYEAAYEELWATLDALDERLGSRRYLMGEHITEADVRLFVTLVRHDVVYYSHFKTSRTLIQAMPNLSGYLRELFQLPGFGDTVDFTHIKEHYYVVHTDINPTQIVPAGPSTAWLLEPHGRDHLPGTPWGEGGTAPLPPLISEVVDPGHTPLTVTGR
ncbi:MAG: glutathione S-transferase C-terminal domain-containing protein [Dermabacter sp.]|nr:glutathione S-transferase C-terminal domain-containing protein [Dermabacter sp.]